MTKKADSMQHTLSTALKEWQVVCRAIEQGRQIILLRKGGIAESAGEFEIEHRQFLLFPTYLHQKLNMLKPQVQRDFEEHSSEPARITLSCACEVTDIIRLKYREQMDALDNQHIWTPPLIDMRFNYKPDRPLYLLLVRAYRLGSPVTIDNTPEYAGCKSWVPLEQNISVENALPVLEDTAYAGKVLEIKQRLKE